MRKGLKQHGEKAEARILSDCPGVTPDKRLRRSGVYSPVGLPHRLIASFLHAPIDGPWLAGPGSPLRSVRDDVGEGKASLERLLRHPAKLKSRHKNQPHPEEARKRCLEGWAACSELRGQSFVTHAGVLLRMRKGEETAANTGGGASLNLLRRHPGQAQREPGSGSHGSDDPPAPYRRILTPRSRISAALRPG